MSNRRMINRRGSYALPALLGIAWMLAGAGYSEAQQVECDVTFSVTNSTSMNALQIGVDYSAVSGGFADGVVCTDETGTTAAILDVNEDQVNSELRVAWIDIDETFSTGNFVTCPVISTAGNPSPGDFVVAVEDASAGNPPVNANPTPVMAVAVSGCAPVASACGNGVAETGESCDDAGESATCNADCSAASCGDGIFNTSAGEECDDGGSNSDAAANACRTDCSLASCGDGVTDSGEDCDDSGESASCDANCTAASCGDGDVNATLGEDCDGGSGCTVSCTSAGSCAAEALSACRSAGLLKNLLKIKDDVKTPGSDVKDSMKFLWKKGTGVSAAELSTPEDGLGASYHFCLYDDTGLVAGHDLSSGGSCGGKDCWKRGGTAFDPKIYLYKNKDGNSDGISLAKLKPGDAGKPLIMVIAKSKAGSYSAPVLPLGNGVTAQFVIDDPFEPVCLEGRFTDVKRNDAVKGLYLAK